MADNVLKLRGRSTRGSMSRGFFTSLDGGNACAVSLSSPPGREPRHSRLCAGSSPTSQCWGLCVAGPSPPPPPLGAFHHSSSSRNLTTNGVMRVSNVLRTSLMQTSNETIWRSASSPPPPPSAPSLRLPPPTIPSTRTNRAHSIKLHKRLVEEIATSLARPDSVSFRAS